MAPGTAQCGGPTAPASLCPVSLSCSTRQAAWAWPGGTSLGWQQAPCTTGQMERVGKVPEAGSMPCHAVSCRAMLCHRGQGCCRAPGMGSSRAEPRWDASGTPAQGTGLPSTGLFHADGQSCSLQAQLSGWGGWLPTLNPDLQPHPVLLLPPWSNPLGSPRTVIPGSSLAAGCPCLVTGCERNQDEKPTSGHGAGFP